MLGYEKNISINFKGYLEEMFAFDIHLNTKTFTVKLFSLVICSRRQKQHSSVLYNLYIHIYVGCHFTVNNNQISCAHNLAQFKSSENKVITLTKYTTIFFK